MVDASEYFPHSSAVEGRWSQVRLDEKDDVPFVIRHDSIRPLRTFVIDVMRSLPRRTRRLMDVTCSAGLLALSFARDDYFDQIGLLHDSPESYDRALHNVSVFQYEKYIAGLGRSQTIADYFSSGKYQKEKAGYAVILNVDRFLTTSTTESEHSRLESLVQLAKTILARGCPALFIYSSSSRLHDLIPEPIRKSLEGLSAQLRRLSTVAIALIDYRHPLGHGIESTQSRRQLRALYFEMGRDAREHLLYIMRNIKLRRSREASQLLLDRLLDNLERGYNDEENYNDLFEYLHGDLLKRPHIARQLEEQPQGTKRAEHRVVDTCRLVQKLNITADTFLDFGCSEGSITASLGAQLGLVTDQIHGCDVLPLPESKRVGFLFAQTDGVHLPYADGTFPLVTAFMSLHHVEQLRPALSEIYRILRPGGYLLIREHDCRPPELAVFLDVLHGMYASVWNEPRETNDFCTTYWAHYRTREDWHDVLKNSGFELVPTEDEFALPPAPHFGDSAELDGGSRGAKRRNIGDRKLVNPFRYYYDVFRKVSPASTDLAK